MSEWTLHTVTFPKEWPIKHQINWLRDHGLKTKKLHEDKNFIRWRQKRPYKVANYYTEVLKNGVHLIFMKKIL